VQSKHPTKLILLHTTTVNLPDPKATEYKGDAAAAAAASGETEAVRRRRRS